VTAISTQPGPAGAARAGRWGAATRLLRGRPQDPAWARPALLALLAATALLYLAGLSRNGWANEFYAAAAQAGTRSWKAFLFGSLDSASFITVDKPPAFLWVMELSARLFGVNYWSLLVPQALEGMATVAVLYTTVRRWFGPSAGLIAGAVMALTPVATLIFRFDDPDALLTLMMTLAAYAATRAIESGRTRWLVLSGTFLGLGFLAKMLAAFLVLPALALAYLCCGPRGAGRRIWQLLAGGAALLATGGWWLAVDLLTPAASRPFVGSTTDNNILQLTFGYNGLSRITGGSGGAGGAGRALGGAGRAAAGGAGRGFGGGAGGAGFSRGGPGGGGFGGQASLTRLFNPEYAGQVSWLIPAALVALVAMVWLSRRAGRTDRTRAAAVLWGGWLLVAGLVLSFMSGTSHSYYTIVLGPAIGALAGIGSVLLWRVRGTWFGRAALAAGLAVTAAWAWVVLGQAAGWLPWLRVVIAVAAVIAVALILAGPARVRPAWAAVPAGLAVLAGLAGPLAYSLDTAASAHSGSSPSAGPALTGARAGLGGAGPVASPAGGEFAGGRFSRGAGAGRAGAADGEFPRFDGGGAGHRAGGAGGFGGFGGAGSATVSSTFARLLEAGASRYTWAAATDGSDSAAAMELATGGVPVMAIGGFRGTDPAPTLAEFEKLVAAHRIHYYVAGGAGGGRAARGLGGGFAGAGGGTSDAARISTWVQARFTARTVGGMTVYTLTAPAPGS